MCTDFGGRRVCPGKCRSGTVESNSDPRSLPSPGRTRTASSDSSAEGGDLGGYRAPVVHTAWAKRVGTHSRVTAALAAWQMSESAGRLICLWSDRLPQQYRDSVDEQLLAAAAGGLGLADLAGLAAEMYVRARGEAPDQDPGREFADRGLKLATTFGGAGVVHGDLTAECTAAVAA